MKSYHKQTEKTKYINPLLKGLEHYYPEMITRLRRQEHPEVLMEIEETIGEKLPESFRQLYEQYDGEDDTQCLGLILGLSLMNGASILETVKFLKNEDTDITSMKTGVISEKSLNERIIVPFAHDYGRCYIAIDLSPDKNGTKGQIITLDYDYNECYLLADSLEEFYNFILKMMEMGKCKTAIGEENEIYFKFESGHFFNQLQDLLADSHAKEEKIQLPKEFWQDYYESDCVTSDTLLKEKVMRINTEVNGISFTPFRYMKNLKELSIYTKDAVIDDFEAIGTLETLKVIRFSCALEEDDLLLLNKLPNLKEVWFCSMELGHIKELSVSTTIKTLHFYRVTGLETSELQYFTKLQELRIRQR